jgi:hypothetical protein
MLTLVERKLTALPAVAAQYNSQAARLLLIAAKSVA